MKRLRYWLIRRLGGHPPLELIPMRGLNVWSGPLSDEHYRRVLAASTESTFKLDLHDDWHQAG